MEFLEYGMRDKINKEEMELVLDFGYNRLVCYIV